MSTLTDYLAEVSAREKAATLGPWRATGPTTGPFALYGLDSDDDYITLQETMAGGDATFIAAARTDVPTLLAMVQAVVELHVSKVTFDGREYCGQCLESDGVKWPCSTIRALTTAKEAGR